MQKTIPAKFKQSKIGLETHQISNDLLNAFLSSIHTLSGSFESDAVTVSARAREADGYASILLRQLSQHLPSSTDEVTVMPGLHDHTVLYHIILRESTDELKEVHIKTISNAHLSLLSYQIFDEGLQLSLGEPHSLLFTHDGNVLLFLLIWWWEDDPCSGSIPYASDISSSSAYQELVVFWLGLKLHWEVVDLLVGQKTNVSWIGWLEI